MTEQRKDEWYLSTTGEHFNDGPYDSPEAAIAAAPVELCLDLGDTFYVGKRGPGPSFSIDVEWVLDSLRNEIADQVGSDLATEEFDATQEEYDELGDALNTALRAWMDRHGIVTRCWTIEEQQEHTYQLAAERAP